MLTAPPGDRVWITRSHCYFLSDLNTIAFCLQVMTRTTDPPMHSLSVPPLQTCRQHTTFLAAPHGGESNSGALDDYTLLEAVAGCPKASDPLPDRRPGYRNRL